MERGEIENFSLCFLNQYRVGNCAKEVKKNFKFLRLNSYNFLLFRIFHFLQTQFPKYTLFVKRIEQIRWLVWVPRVLTRSISYRKSGFRDIVHNIINLSISCTKLIYRSFPRYNRFGSSRSSQTIDFSRRFKKIKN